MKRRKMTVMKKAKKTTKNKSLSSKSFSSLVVLIMKILNSFVIYTIIAKRRSKIYSNYVKALIKVME